MKEKLILIGAGGHCKSVVDSIDTEKYEIVGFLDENKSGIHLNKPIFGNKIEDIEDYRKYKYFVSIGGIEARKMWYERLIKYKLETVNIIDKTAIISPTAVIGKGNFIGKFAILNAEVCIGDNNVINTKALLEHECKIGNHCHISTNSAVNGEVLIGDCVFMGSSSVCNGQLKIGENSIIGSGSVIIKDIEPNNTVVGVPGRVIKKNGERV